MPLLITVDYPCKNPTILVVVEDEEQAKRHAAQVCRIYGAKMHETWLKAKAEINGQTYRWYWDWQRPAPNIWSGPGQWSWKYAGIELSRIELYAIPHDKDLAYLMRRVRAMNSESNEVPRIQQATATVPAFAG